MKLKPISSDQFALPFLDTTSLGGFGLYGGSSAPPVAREPADTDDAEADREKPAKESSVPSASRNYRLAENRKLAATWKGKAADNLAAIRLASLIEAEGRPALPDEQEQLARARSAF